MFYFTCDRCLTRRPFARAFSDESL